MINAYPSVLAVNRYQTHKDYYRVSAVSAVTGGKSNTIRFKNSAETFNTRLAASTTSINSKSASEEQLQAYLPVPMRGLLLDATI